jgi:hypothetical protein
VCCAGWNGSLRDGEFAEDAAVERPDLARRLSHCISSRVERVFGWDRFCYSTRVVVGGVVEPDMFPAEVLRRKVS